MPAICNENNLLCLLLVILSAIHWHDIVLYKARWGGVGCPAVAMWVVGGLRTLNQRESPTVNSPWPFPVKTLPAKEASTVQDRIVLFLCPAFWDFRGLCWDLWRPRLERKLSSWVHWAWSYNRHSISSMLGLGDLHTSRKLLQNAKICSCPPLDFFTDRTAKIFVWWWRCFSKYMLPNDVHIHYRSPWVDNP